MYKIIALSLPCNIWVLSNVFPHFFHVGQKMLGMLVSY